MRSYQQYCGLAKALDVVGDRWTLLIVRELLIQDACRYTDLRDGLPGIATNLLARRLREMETAGLLTREEAPPPIATTLFRLTPRGRELKPILLLLGHWGAPLLSKLSRQDAFRTHWLSLPLEHHLVDRAPSLPPLIIELRTGDQSMTLETVAGKVKTRLGPASHPDAVLVGPHPLVFDCLTGKLELAQAVAAGLQYKGDPQFLSRIRKEPHPQPRTKPPSRRKGQPGRLS